MNLWLIFLTGLTVGGLTCLAVQGGLLASVIASRESEEVEDHKNTRNNFWPTASFLVSKLIAYILLGAFLGGFGQVLSISDEFQTWIQILAGVYMLLVALNLLNIHPIFRYAIIQPPKALARLIRNQSRSKDIFAPALLGVMTIFIPCGTTLAMEALAISSGNPMLGAAVMGDFILGTMPLFFGVGFLTTILGDVYRSRFLKFAGILVLYLGINSVNGGLNALGSPITLESIYANIPIEIRLEEVDQGVVSEEADGVQIVDINVYADAYSPNYAKVKAGMPVRVNLTTIGPLGCSSAFRVPSLGIKKRLYENSTDSFEFTPQKQGRIAYSCAMGMYKGVIEVI
jgi:uncharacterized protein